MVDITSVVIVLLGLIKVDVFNDIKKRLLLDNCFVIGCFSVTVAVIITVSCCLLDFGCIVLFELSRRK